MMPKKMITENNINLDLINSKREDGRLTKEDVLKVAKDFMHPDAFQVIVVGEDIDLQ